ncbi:hypothetical protein AB6813_05880 [bacterium RCC_150]
MSETAYNKPSMIRSPGAAVLLRLCHEPCLINEQTPPGLEA